MAQKTGPANGAARCTLCVTCMNCEGPSTVPRAWACAVGAQPIDIWRCEHYVRRLPPFPVADRRLGPRTPTRR